MRRAKGGGGNKGVSQRARRRWNTLLIMVMVVSLTNLRSLSLPLLLNTDHIDTEVDILTVFVELGVVVVGDSEGAVMIGWCYGCA